MDKYPYISFIYEATKQNARIPYLDQQEGKPFSKAVLQDKLISHAAHHHHKHSPRERINQQVTVVSIVYSRNNVIAA